jgi:hypothetical protein
LGGVVHRLFRIAILLVISTAVLAQTPLRDRDPDLAGAKRVLAELEQANFHYGSLYLLSRLRISDAGYSESFYLPADEQSGGGVSLNVEAPQRLYYRPHKKVVFSGEVVPGYSFVRSDESNGQFNYLARGDAHLLFNHLYIDAYTTRASQLRTYAADVNRLVTTDDRETGVTGEAKYSSRTSSLFAFRYRDTEHPLNKINPDPDERRIDRLNRIERNGRVSVHHKTFPITSTMIAAELSSYTFDVDRRRDSTRRWVGLGLSRDSGRMSMRLEAGPAALDFEAPGQRDFSGVIVVFDATRGAGRWLYGFHADRDLGFSVLPDSNFYVAHRARVNAAYSATRRLTLRAQSTFERDEFEAATADATARRDTISYTSLGFLYTIRRVQLGTDVGWLSRTSSSSDAGDEGIRWTLLLSFTP